MSIKLLFILGFLIALHFQASEAARYGGGRSYSSARFRSGSYRSLRSFKADFQRSTRYSYFYSSRSSVYKGQLKLSTEGMGGITSNKRAILLAGSVYIANPVRPHIFASREVLYDGVVEEFAVCSGLVRWDAVSKNGSYAYDEFLAWENSTTSAPTSATGEGNRTSADFVMYNYFLCPNDLLDNAFNRDDIYCCGAHGSQMCCSLEDFNEQFGSSKTTAIIVSMTVVLIFIGISGYAVYHYRKNAGCRNCCRSCCRGNSNCGRSCLRFLRACDRFLSSNPPGEGGRAPPTTTTPRRPNVIFHHVTKTDDEPHVVIYETRDRQSSSSNSSSSSSSKSSKKSSQVGASPQLNADEGPPDYQED